MKMYWSQIQEAEVSKIALTFQLGYNISMVMAACSISPESVLIEGATTEGKKGSVVISVRKRGYNIL